jgi:hypothetical protein
MAATIRDHPAKRAKGVALVRGTIPRIVAEYPLEIAFFITESTEVTEK